MIRLYIVRHGKTFWNELGLIQGTTDISMNEVGIEETKNLANTIDLDKIDVCICSPLKRTRETAEILTRGKVNILYDDLIIERGYGDYEGTKIDKEMIAKQWDYKLNSSSYNSESIRDCLKRAENFVEKIKEKYQNKNILVVTHGGFMKALHFAINGYDVNTDFLSFYAKNSEIYEYEV